jgi:hypothetical protein
MFKKATTGLIGVFTFCGAIAQDSAKTAAPTPSTTFTYSIDGYYRADFSGQLANNKTSFTNSNNSFALGMASIRVDHSFGKVSATADLGFGQRANEFSYNETGALQTIKQAYISYAPSSKIKFTLGKWATHVGYEVLDAYANRNYSMDYMFSYGPFFHTGLKADITLGKKSAFMVGVSNPCDLTSTTSSTKAFIAQFSTATKDDKFKLFVNFMGHGGVSSVQTLTPYYTLYKSLSQFDAVINYTVSGKFSLGYNGTIQTINDGDSKSWYGSALYLNYDPTSKFGLTLRGEYFDDNKGIKFAGGAKITDFTLSGNIKIDDHLTIIPEIRLDNSDNKIFLDGSGSATSSAGNVLVAAVYKF